MGKTIWTTREKVEWLLQNGRHHLDEIIVTASDRQICNPTGMYRSAAEAIVRVAEARNWPAARAKAFIVWALRKYLSNMPDHQYVTKLPNWLDDEWYLVIEKRMLYRERAVRVKEKEDEHYKAIPFSEFMKIAGLEEWALDTIPKVKEEDRVVNTDEALKRLRRIVKKGK